MKTRTISARTMLAYSTGGFVATSIYSFCNLYLFRFYTDVVHLDTRLIGYAILLHSVIDAGSDPIMGYVSDQSNGFRTGRRRSYLFAGAIGVSLLFPFLFLPIRGAPFVKFLFLATASSMLFVVLTVFETPYTALAPSLTNNYTDRIRLSGFRRTIEIVAEISGNLGVPICFALLAGVTGDADSQSSYFLAACLVAVICLGSGILSFSGTREPALPEERCKYRIADALKGVLANRPFLILLTTFTLISVGDRFAMAQLFFLLEHFHGVTEGDAAPLMIVFFAGSLLCVWPWVALTGAIGKKRAYMISIMVWGGALCSLTLDNSSPLRLYLIGFLLGAGSAGVFSLPMALFPDTIERDEVRTDQRREGIYMGLWTFVSQIGMGIASVVLGQLLFAIGYEGGITPSPSTVLGLRIIFAVVPLTLLTLGVLVFTAYPITKEAHEETLRTIDNRRRGAAVPISVDASNDAGACPLV